MAADIGRIARDLTGFYDFSGKDVVYVGAGGGRLLDAVKSARRLQAVDQDAAALEQLRQAAARMGLATPLTLTAGDYAGTSLKGDVVYFEFCLHEMPDPATALGRALSSAPEVVVLDHLPDSPWVVLTGETGKAAASWAALARLPARRQERFEGVQAFKDYEDIRSKLAVLGPAALERIEPFRARKDFQVLMPYGAVLL